MDGDVCLTSPTILETQVKWADQRKAEEAERKVKRRQRFETQQRKVRKICNKLEDKWTNQEYKTMLTYKKVKNDVPTANIKDRSRLVELWEERRNRKSPTCSDADDDSVEGFVGNLTLKMEHIAEEDMLPDVTFGDV